jgi:hypothetical protein
MHAEVFDSLCVLWRTIGKWGRENHCNLRSSLQFNDLGSLHKEVVTIFPEYRRTIGFEPHEP